MNILNGMSYVAVIDFKEDVRHSMEEMMERSAVERVEMVSLVRRRFGLGDDKDFSDFIRILKTYNVDFLIVGGYARALHGSPRSTVDLDLFMDMRSDNIHRVIKAVKAFLPVELDEPALYQAEKILQIGKPPNRIDIMTSLSGITWEEAWISSVECLIFGLPARFIGREAFIKNKRAAGRLKDLADIEALGEAV